MSYVTQDTIWPDAVTLDSKVKDIIDLFYQLADDTSPEAGPRMAEEVFTDSARMVAGTGTFEGSAAISHSRDRAWEAISARHHNILQVFVNDKAGRDLFMLGKAKMGLRNGKDVVSSFTAHIIVDADSKAVGKPKIELMEVYADSAPLVNALKES